MLHIARRVLARHVFSRRSRHAAACALALGLSGCVAYDDGYGPGYYAGGGYGSGYYGASGVNVYAPVYYRGGGYHPRPRQEEHHEHGGYGGGDRDGGYHGGRSEARRDRPDHRAYPGG